MPLVPPVPPVPPLPGGGTAPQVPKICPAGMMQSAPVQQSACVVQAPLVGMHGLEPPGSLHLSRLPSAGSGTQGSAVEFGSFGSLQQSAELEQYPPFGLHVFRPSQRGIRCVSKLHSPFFHSGFDGFALVGQQFDGNWVDESLQAPPDW